MVGDLDLVGDLDIMGAGLDNSQAVRDITRGALRAGMEEVSPSVLSKTHQLNYTQNRRSQTQPSPSSSSSRLRRTRVKIERF